MDVLTIYPQTKEQLIAYQSLAKAFQNRVVKNKGEVHSSSYNPEFVERILAEKTAGNYEVIKTEDLWK